MKKCEYCGIFKKRLDQHNCIVKTLVLNPTPDFLRVLLKHNVGNKELIEENKGLNKYVSELLIIIKDLKIDLEELKQKIRLTVENLKGYINKKEEIDLKLLSRKV